MVRAVTMSMVAEHLQKNGSVKLKMEQAYNWGRGAANRCSVFSILAHVTLIRIL